MGSQQRWYTQLRYLNSVFKKYLLTILWVGLKEINMGGWNSLDIWTTKSFTAPYAWKNKEKEQWQEPSFKRRFLIETIIFGKRIWLLLTHTLAGGSQEINSSFLHPILPLVHAVGWTQPEDGRLRSPDWWSTWRSPFWDKEQGGKEWSLDQNGQMETIHHRAAIFNGAR